VHTSLLAIYAIVHFLKLGREVHTHEIEAKADTFAVNRLGNADNLMDLFFRSNHRNLEFLLPILESSRVSSSAHPVLVTRHCALLSHH
jgi:hypothetical protein